MAAFYAVYTWTRNLFGSNKIAADGIPDQAFTNAERVIQFERWLGLFHEETIQDWFLPYRTFIQFWNIFLRGAPLRCHTRGVHPALRQARRRLSTMA